MFQHERVTSQNPFSWRTGKLTSLFALLLLLAGVSPRLTAQAGEWTWMGGSNTVGQPGVYGTLGVPAAGNVPGARGGAATWMDSKGNFWLFGGCFPSFPNGNPNFDVFNDLWKYAPSTGEWTWMGGSNSGYPPAPGVYGTLGVPAAGNVPGARVGASSWIDSSGNLWLFGGLTFDANTNPSDFNDLWKYTPSTGEWTWVNGSNSAGWAGGVYGTLGVPAPANVPPGRGYAVSWIDSSGNLWLFGGSQAFDLGPFNDLWKYTPSTGEWTWMSGSNTPGQSPVYGTKGVPAAGNMPGGRDGAAGWTDSSGNLWLFGGGYNADTNDLWKYTPSTGEWTWMSGNSPTDYGSPGVPAAGNVPGARDGVVSWTDSGGNLWLFGGAGVDANGNGGELSDVWRYTLSTGEWAWMGGSDTVDQPGVYGTLGVPASGNVPGGRSYAASWMGSSGNVWLFGGYSNYLNGGQFPLNDLWKYTPATTPPPSMPALTTPAPDSTLSGSTETFAWSNPGNIATRFVLRLGTTGFGTMDVYHPSPTTDTTAQVSGIPTNGAYLYAALWYYVNGTWKYSDALYTEAGTPTPPALTTPAPGSTLSGSTVTFGWSPGAGPTRYVLRLGTTGFGSMDVYSGPATTGTSEQVTTVPTNGAKLYATLWYYLNGTWQYVDATYTEASQ